LQQMLMHLIEKQIISSAHDVSEGGLFVTLCESGFNKGLGFAINTANNIRKDAFLFGEGQSRVVVSISENKKALFEKELYGTTFAQIGVVTDSIVKIDNEDWGTIDSWKNLYDSAIEKIMNNTVANEMPATL